MGEALPAPLSSRGLAYSTSLAAWVDARTYQRDWHGRFGKGGPGPGEGEGGTRVEGDVWDDDQRAALAKTAADLQARYDVPLKAIRHDPERTSAGKSNDTIYLPTMWSDRGAMAKREAEFQGLMVKPTLEGTVAHEYGHILDGAVMRNPEARAEWDDYLNTEVEGPGGRMIPRVRSGLEAASPYGAENRYEFAAEAFADHWANGDNAGPAGKAFGAIVDRHFGKPA